jgi:hypothetical protein
MRPSPGSCGRGMRARTPPPTTSPSPTRHWRRSPTTLGTGSRSWSAPTGAGATKAWLAHLHGLRRPVTEGGNGLDLDYSVGFTMTEQVQAAILALPPYAWTPAVQVDGDVREGAAVAELTGVLKHHGLDLAGNGWPPGIRIIVRRERPHPGAQLTFSESRATGSRPSPPTRPAGSSPLWRPGTAPTPGSRTGSAPARTPGSAGSPPATSRSNAVWLQLALTAADLIAWTQTMLLDGDLAAAEPKKLRYRLLHVAARITRGQRKTWIRIQTALGRTTGRRVRPAPADSHPDLTPTAALNHPVTGTTRRPRTPRRTLPHAPTKGAITRNEK